MALQIEELLKEYVDSEDLSEAMRCLLELEVPHFHHELVFQVTTATSDCSASDDDVNYCKNYDLYVELMVTMRTMLEWCQCFSNDDDYAVYGLDLDNDDENENVGIDDDDEEDEEEEVEDDLKQ